MEKRRVNSDVLIEFLNQIGACHRRRKIGIIMGQAPCHIAKKVKSFADSTKRMKIFHLPPYSPDLNPDEKVWRHMKHVSLKNHQAQDKRQLSRLVLGALRKMQKNPNLIKNLFENYLRAPLNIHFLLRPAVQAAYCVALGLPKMRCASSRGRYHCGYALLARLVCGLLARPRDKTE